MNPSAQAVFDTLELFESILLQVDTKTLLLSQRASKTWRDNIKASKPIQRALFFIPALTTHGIQFADSTLGLILRDSTIPMPLCQRGRRRARHHRDEEGSGMILNPLAIQHITLPFTTTTTNIPRQSLTPEQIQAWNRPEAFHRRMYISQPPKKGVKADVTLQPKVTPLVPRWKQQSDVESEDRAVTIGDIYDHIAHYYVSSWTARVLTYDYVSGSIVRVLDPVSETWSRVD